MMTKDKQIEEIENLFIEIEQSFRVYCGEKPCNDCELNGFVNCESHYKAEALYEAGYRLASDVASEIFEEIEEEIRLALNSNYNARSERLAHTNIEMADEFVSYCDGKIHALRGIDDYLAELKKKYTESEKDNE